MARYKVQQRDWKHWPKVIVVEQWNEYGLAFGRYVPDKGTCKPVISDNLNESEGTGDAWADCSECGHLLFVLTDPNSQPPNYCPGCGRKVVG